MVGVRKDLFDESPHVSIVGHVVDPGPVASGPNQSGQSKFGQVLGDPGRMGSYEGGKFIDRMLAVEQGPDDPETGLVAEQLEHAHSGLEFVLGRNHIYLRIHADRLPSKEVAVGGTLHNLPPFGAGPSPIDQTSR
jgi:hypothetical protein